jgi:hypothetical protein
MKTAVEWLMTKLQSLGITKEEHYELLRQLELEAKEMEKEQSLKMPTYNLDDLADEYYKKFDNLPIIRYNAYVAGFKKAMELLTFKQQEQ